MKKAVLFDLFGTLVPSPPLDEYRSMVDSVAETLGIEPAQFFEPWMSINDGRLSGAFGSPHAEVQHAASMFNITPTADQLAICAEVRREAVFGWITPKTDAIEVLKTLKSSGHQLALVTDCVFDVPAVWTRTEFAEAFHETIFSCEQKTKKPDRRMYERALEGVGAQPGESLFIGDGGSNELHGATAVGIDAVLLDDHDAEARVMRVGLQAWGGPSIASLADVIRLAAD